MSLGYNFWLSVSFVCLKLSIMTSPDPKTNHYIDMVYHVWSIFSTQHNFHSRDISILENSKLLVSLISVLIS